jgi:hypothetical protein
MAFAFALLSVASTTGMANPIIVVTPGSERYNGVAVADTASGLFGGADGVLPFAAGVVLTSGSIDRVFDFYGTEGSDLGSNNSAQFSVINNQPSNSYLNSLDPAQTVFGDASTLEFRFTTTGTAISFQYVFGSEEYPIFPETQYNDVFGFFLNGQNIALIPGTTTTPVSISTVNDQDNSQYYYNNSAGQYAIQYNGLVGGLASQPLFASATVTPGLEYTILLGVEDVGDLQLDSGVMLAAGSLVATGIPEPPPEPIPEPATLLTSASGLVVLARYIRRRGRAA